MGLPLGIVVEGSVAILLVVTIAYCAVLNRRLKRLQTDRDTLGRMVQELVQATALADRAVGELSETAAETQERIDARLEAAARIEGELANQIEVGEALLERIARITSLARRPERRAEPEHQPAPAATEEPTAAMRDEESPIQAALRQLASRPRIGEQAA